MTRGRSVPRAPAIVGAVCAALAGSLWIVGVACAGWSAPASPPGCATALATPQPLVVFPSAGPLVRSGPGALLWTAPRGCGAQGVGATAETLGAPLGVDDLPGPGRALVPSVGGLATVTAATGTAAGDVLTVGAPGAAAASGYLGDAVLAVPVRSPRGGWELAVRTQRHYSSALGRPRLVPVGAGPVTAVAAALDYRAEILLVWAARGEVYARELPAAGAAGPARRLGRGGADPEIGALLSDDGHAIVVWRSQSAANTAIELSLFQTGSGATLEPGSLQPIERYRDPPGFPPPPGSLRLIRLSSEAVMAAWTGLAVDGRYVVRASPVSLRRGAWAPVTISRTAAARGNAVLADLVPGPHAEALALWTATPQRLDGRSARRTIFAAQGHYAGAGEVAFAAPELVASPDPVGTPVAAFDPQTGRALVAWVTLAGSPHIEYALRTLTPVAVPAVSATPPTALACCLGLAPLYASIDSSAIRIGTPLAACLK